MAGIIDLTELGADAYGWHRQSSRKAGPESCRVSKRQTDGGFNKSGEAGGAIVTRPCKVTGRVFVLHHHAPLPIGQSQRKTESVLVEPRRKIRSFGVAKGRITADTAMEGHVRVLGIGCLGTADFCDSQHRAVDFSYNKAGTHSDRCGGQQKRRGSLACDGYEWAGKVIAFYY